MFMSVFTSARGDRSIGVGFASATVLKAKSNATGIKGFISLASLLNASGNHWARPSFPVGYHMGVNAIGRYLPASTQEKAPVSQPDRKAGHRMCG
jgi:hypothetical protein